MGKEDEQALGGLALQDRKYLSEISDGAFTVVGFLEDDSIFLNWRNAAVKGIAPDSPFFSLAEIGAVGLVGSIDKLTNGDSLQLETMASLPLIRPDDGNNIFINYAIPNWFDSTKSKFDPIYKQFNLSGNLIIIARAANKWLQDLQPNLTTEEGDLVTQYQRKNVTMRITSKQIVEEQKKGKNTIITINSNENESIFTTISLKQFSDSKKVALQIQTGRDGVVDKVSKVSQTKLQKITTQMLLSIKKV